MNKILNKIILLVFVGAMPLGSVAQQTSSLFSPAR